LLNPVPNIANSQTMATAANGNATDWRKAIKYL
jgi:hypothetical protein